MCHCTQGPKIRYTMRAYVARGVDLSTEQAAHSYIAVRTQEVSQVTDTCIHTCGQTTTPWQRNAFQEWWKQPVHQLPHGLSFQNSLNGVNKPPGTPPGHSLRV